MFNVIHWICVSCDHMCVEQTRNQSLQSYFYQLWSAVLASSNTFMRQRLPMTSSYQLSPSHLLNGESVTSQQGSKFNPFINSPPLTADVDTNRSDNVFSFMNVSCYLICNNTVLGLTYNESNQGL